MQKDEYRLLLNRLLGETSLARSEELAYSKLYACEINSRTSFLALTFYALSNDALSHAIKVLEIGQQCRSYWTVEALKRSEIRAFAYDNRTDLRRIHSLSKKLKKVRNKTHFHIDTESLINPDFIWNDAGIKMDEFSDGLRDIWAILLHLYRLEFGTNYPHVDDYDGSDVERIVELAKNQGLVKIGATVTIS